MVALLPGITLAVVLTGFVAYGLAVMQRGQGGGFLNWIVSQATAVAKTVEWAAEQVVPLTKFLTHELGQAFNAVYQQIAQWLSGIEDGARLAADAVYHTALAMARWNQWLVSTYLPRVIHPVTTTVNKVVSSTTKVVKVIQRDAVTLTKATKAYIRAAVAVAIPGALVPELPLLKWIRQHWKRIVAGAAGLSIPWLHPWRIATDKRIKRLEKLLGLSGLAALVTATFGAEVLRFLRCRNTRGIAKTWCGANLNALENLFLGLLAVVGGFGLIEFGQAMQGVIGEGVKGVETFWQTDVAAGGRSRQYGQA